MSIDNIFTCKEIRNEGEESFETLFTTKDVRIEKIFTHGKITAPGNWYNQSKDEWVLLLQGVATLEFSDNKFIELNKGDYLFIPAHAKHRLIQTSRKPDCVWLAIHGDKKNTE